ncbi:MAG: hypothetical protein HC904_09960 [Blastochloris sp.]|nr:hypothetical protein [Blastochloris sp.]
MTAEPPASETPAATPPVRARAKKLSPAWWLVSLLLHAAVLGILFVVFPYQEFVMPKAREKQNQPIVNQKVLEATTQKIEEKQAEEMARKLRELESLTAEIVSVETRQRSAHASFKETFTQLSPELARDLAGLAREQLQTYAEVFKADQDAWAAALQGLQETAPTLANPAEPTLKETLARLEDLFKKLPGTQDKLNFRQAALLETQQQIAGRLGFLKSQEPELVAQQARLVAAWENTMGLGAEYTSKMGPLIKLLSATQGACDGLNQARRTLVDREKKLREIEAAIEKRNPELVKLQSTLSALTEEQKASDPADKKKAKDFENRLKKANEALNRVQVAQNKDTQTKEARVKALEEGSRNLKARTEDMVQRLAGVAPAQEAIVTARAPYHAEMQKALELQNSLDAKMTATLAVATTEPIPGTEPVSPPEPSSQPLATESP